MTSPRAAATWATWRNSAAEVTKRTSGWPALHLLDRHGAGGRLERDPAVDQGEHLVVVQGERLDPEVVHVEERRQPVGPRGAEPDDPAPDGLAEHLAGPLEVLVVEQRLPARRRPQLGGVDARPDEVGPVGQQVVDRVGQQHPLEVDAVARALRRVDRHGQHVRDPAQPGGRRRRAGSSRTASAPAGPARTPAAPPGSTPPGPTARRRPGARVPSTVIDTGSSDAVQLDEPGDRARGRTTPRRPDAR